MRRCLDALWACRFPMFGLRRLWWAGLGQDARAEFIQSSPGSASLFLRKTWSVFGYFSDSLYVRHANATHASCDVAFFYHTSVPMCSAPLAVMVEPLYPGHSRRAMLMLTSSCCIYPTYVSSIQCFWLPQKSININFKTSFVFYI